MLDHGSEFPLFLEGTNIPEGINIVSYTASPLIGALVNSAMFGVLSVQVYIYHLNFSDDKQISKCLVYGVYFIEVVQTVLSGVDAYHWFGVGYGNFDYLMEPFTAWFNTPLLCGIVALIVQFFFAYRIWSIQQQRHGILLVIIIGGIIITALLQLAGALMTAQQALKIGRYDRFHESKLFAISYYMWLLGDAISDVLIAAAMLWTHYSHRLENNHNPAFGGNKLLARLVRLVIETNSLTASMALLSFILFLSLPHTSSFILTAVVMGKLYANTLLVTFNNRITLRKVQLGTTTHSDSRQCTSTYSPPNNPTTSQSGVDSASTQTLNDPDQKSSYQLDSLDDRNDSSDVFGFQEGVHAHAGKRDVEEIEIEVLKSVEVMNDTGSSRGYFEGRRSGSRAL